MRAAAWFMGSSFNGRVEPAAPAKPAPAAEVIAAEKRGLFEGEPHGTPAAPWPEEIDEA